MPTTIEEREPIDIQHKSFSLNLDEREWQTATVVELMQPLRWNELRLLIQSVKASEALIGNDYVARHKVDDLRRSKMTILASWMFPAGFPDGHGTIPGGQEKHGGQGTVNSLYREAWLCNLIGIVLWHRNRYKPISWPVVGYKLIGNHRFHESYDPTEEDLKKPWWR